MVALLSILMIWILVGICGTIFEDYMRINWCMVVFLAFFPCIPWVMHWCGLF